MALLKVLVLLTLAALIGACSDQSDHELHTPDTIRVGVLPDQSEDSLVRKYTPLVDYLSEQTSLDLELVIPGDYASMLDDFSAHRLHIANFGGLTFTEAERRDNAQPLVMRDTDLNFASCYLVQHSDIRRSLAEFEGAAFAFGPRLSTSGHLMPRHFLQSTGLDPESFFSSIRYSSGHDETARWVQEGEIEIGVANCVIVGSMFADGRLRQDEVQVLETTPAYVDYVWAVDRDLSPSIKMRLRDAFMNLDITVPKHQTILRQLGATAYLPATAADFDDVRRAARNVMGAVDVESE